MYPPPVGEKSITPMPGFLQDGDGGDVLEDYNSGWEN